MPVITHPTAGCPVCGEPYSAKVEYHIDEWGARKTTVVINPETGRDWWWPNCMDEWKECSNLESTKER